MFGGGRTVPPVSKPGLPDLTAAEREALVAAGAWYAEYHASDIAADAGDSSNRRRD